MFGRKENPGKNISLSILFYYQLNQNIVSHQRSNRISLFPACSLENAHNKSKDLRKYENTDKEVTER